jgi:hypothetical protein
MGRICRQNGRRYNRFQNFNKELTGEILLGRPRRRWEENIRMGMSVNTRDWTASDQDKDYSRAIVYAILNFGFHKLWSYLVKYLFSYLR